VTLAREYRAPSEWQNRCQTALQFVIQPIIDLTRTQRQPAPHSNPEVYMNEPISSARRGDDQLLAILDQPADWTVNGRAGCTLSIAYTLRDAIRSVFDHEANGKHVFAVCRQPGNEIILFREQVERVAVAEGIITNRRGWPGSLSNSRPCQVQSRPGGRPTYA
jgi:hypothetical protein